MGRDECPTNHLAKASSDELANVPRWERFYAPGFTLTCTTCRVPLPPGISLGKSLQFWDVAVVQHLSHLPTRQLLRLTREYPEERTLSRYFRIRINVSHLLSLSLSQILRLFCTTRT